MTVSQSGPLLGCVLKVLMTRCGCCQLMTVVRPDFVSVGMSEASLRREIMTISADWHILWLTHPRAMTARLSINKSYFVLYGVVPHTLAVAIPDSLPCPLIDTLLLAAALQAAINRRNDVIDETLACSSTDRANDARSSLFPQIDAPSCGSLTVSTTSHCCWRR